ncbi:hypothetical protein ABZ896_13185 [Streptomyces sp. NPDC047072]|uniref:hypothetical protein n=1 Tax=Streptomyces sp. NPDC047072 TaxID=3154809 RepID=UPI00340E1742
MPTWRPSDDAGGGGAGGGGGSSGGGSGGGGGGSGSGGSSSGGSGPGPVEKPNWLRPGPRSPNTEQSPDPEFIYDELGRKPGECAATLGIIESQPDKADPAWQVLSGLAHVCLAVQGQSGGTWDKAAEHYAAAKGGADTCKGQAAYAVLGDLLRFHRQHPSATDELSGSDQTGGKAVCTFRIVKATPAEVKAGDQITVQVSGAPFSPEDLVSVSVGNFLVGGAQPPDGLTFVEGSQSKDRFSFTTTVPSFATYPRIVDVWMKYGVEDTLEKAFTVVDPNPTTAP